MGAGSPKGSADGHGRKTPDGLDVSAAPHRRVLRTTLGLLGFALVLHVFVLPLFSNFGDTWDTLTSLDPVLLLAAIAIEVGAWWLMGESLRRLLPRGHRPSGAFVYAVTLASNGLSRLIPAGAAAVAGLQFVLLRKARVPDGKIAYAVTAAGLLSAITLNASLVAAVVIGLFSVKRFNSYVVPAIAGAAIVVVIVGGVVLVLRHTGATARLIAKAVGWIPMVDRRSVEEWVKSTARRVDGLMDNPGRLAELALVAGARWVVESLALWVVFAALDTRLNLLVAMTALSLSYLVSSIPISPGGLGVFEATMIGVVVAFGTDHTTATAGVMAFRGISFWLMIPLGAIANVVANWAIKNQRGLAPPMEGGVTP